MLRALVAGLVLVVGLALPMVAPQSAQAVPPGTYAYVANFNDDTVSVIDTATNAVVVTVPVGDAPWEVAVSPGGTRAYVTNRADATVSVINTATDT
ncbi:YncE family protein, partial [Streptomyces goshikiensis]